MLKQEFSEFSVSKEEGLYKGYDRFQKILSQLNQIQAKPDNDDVNMKFLKALPPSLSQVALTLKTRGGLEYLSFDDLYNKLRSLEIDVKGGSTYGSRALWKMYFINIKWQMAMLSLRINRFQKKAGRKINFNNKDPARFNRRKARCYNYLHLGHFARECNVKKVDEKHEAENKTEDGEQVYVLMAGFKSDFVDHAGNATGSVSDATAEFAMMGISPKMAMLLLRINRFQKKTGRKINFNNKDPARFDRKKARCYNCLQLGYFARECNVKKVDEKARYSAFKISEVKTEEPKAIVSVDSMLNWNEHEAENKTKEGEQVYGLMAGFKSDFADHAGNAAGSVYDAAAEFAMMGISPKAKIEKKEWEVKLVESLARFDKWKESSKNLATLINSSMSTRTKLGLGFKEYIGSDEVFDISTPNVFDPEPENREVKSLYERFVKAGEMHEVPPSITGTFMPTSYKSDLEENPLTFGSNSNTSSINTSESNDFVSCDNSDKSSESETYDFASYVSSPKTNDSFSTVDAKILPKSDVKDPSPANGFPSCSFKKNVKPPRNLCNKSGIADRIHCKNNFVRTKTCFVCGSKYHLIKDCDVYDNVDTFPSVVSKATYVPAGSKNSSASISAGRSIPAASRNRPASIHVGRHIHAGRFTKPAPFPTGRFVPTGWTNHTARPFFRPTNLYVDNVSWPGIYDHMSMNEGRWGSAVKSSAGCSWRYNRPYMKWGSKNNVGSHQSTWFHT
nr:ribonuclease H-like domain-containing protein [Tanacetum cinerariifolium]